MTEALPPIHYLKSIVQRGIDDIDLQPEEAGILYQSLFSGERDKKVGLRRLVLGEHPIREDRIALTDTLQLIQQFVDLTQNPEEITERRVRVASLLVNLLNTSAEFDGETYSTYAICMLEEVNPALLASAHVEKKATAYIAGYKHDQFLQLMFPMKFFNMIFNRALEGKPVNIEKFQGQVNAHVRSEAIIEQHKLRGEHARRPYA